MTSLTKKTVTTPPISREMEAFLAKIRALEPGPETGGRGRLIFALDATASRESTWDSACQLQAEMFKETRAIGGLDVQLVYFRGTDECRASQWVSDPSKLTALMEKIMCRTGETQINRVLSHARIETRKARVQAMVFVGDSCEEEKDDLLPAAHRLGLCGVPVFMFKERSRIGLQSRYSECEIEEIFREIAQRTHGAYCKFDKDAVNELRDLLRAVAVFAAGGMEALSDQRSAGAIKLLGQMR